jgi:hypothetical protein
MSDLPLSRPQDAGIRVGTLFSYATWHEGEWIPCADRWLAVKVERLGTVNVFSAPVLFVDALNQHGRLSRLQIYRSDRLVTYVG